MYVSLELVKKHCVLDSYDGDDDLLLFYIGAAEEYVVKLTNRDVNELFGMSGNGESLPRMLQQAIMLVTAQWYDQREPNSSQQFHELPNSLQALIRPYRRLTKKTAE